MMGLVEIDPKVLNRPVYLYPDSAQVLDIAGIDG